MKLYIKPIDAEQSQTHFSIYKEAKKKHEKTCATIGLASLGLGIIPMIFACAWQSWWLLELGALLQVAGMIVAIFTPFKQERIRRLCGFDTATVHALHSYSELLDYDNGNVIPYSTGQEAPRLFVIPAKDHHKGGCVYRDMNDFGLSSYAELRALFTGDLVSGIHIVLCPDVHLDGTVGEKIVFEFMGRQ